MTSILRRDILGGVGAAAAWRSAVAASDTPADLILHNGRIWTGDPKDPEVQFVAVRRGIVVGVGTQADFPKWQGPKTQLVDAEGHRVIPGVNDAHDHGGSAPPGVEILTNPPAEADAPLAVLVDALARARDSAPKGAWLFAKAGPSVMREPAAILKAIETVSADHPVAIMAWWGHGLILNRAGQDWAGLSNASLDSLGGWLDRDATGRFTGRLDEYAGAAIWRRLSTVVPHETHVRAFRAYAARRHAQGVTSVQIMTTSQPPLALAKTVTDARAKLNVRLMQYVIPAEDGVTPLKARRFDPLTRLDGVKYVIDGTPFD